MKPIRILMVEDSEADAELCLLELAHIGFDVTHERVLTETAMRDALARERWDIILSDYSLPTFGALLAGRGHIVLEAGSLEEARAILQNSVPDVVLTDIQLGDGRGEELLSDIRGTETLAALPVLATTAYAMQGDRERFLAAGFNGYISKPIDAQALTVMVDSLAAGGRR